MIDSNTKVICQGFTGKQVNHYAFWQALMALCINSFHYADTKKGYFSQPASDRLWHQDGRWCLTCQGRLYSPGLACVQECYRSELALRLLIVELFKLPVKMDDN
jgi:hypothetical protein